MDRAVVDGLIRCTEDAAIASAAWTGKGDNKAADRAAVDAMRSAFRNVPMDGTIVIGEGERDEAPMLFIGEDVGLGGTPMDIAVDPLEGTKLCADGKEHAISVIAIGPDQSLLHAPDTYMDKIAAGPDITGIDLDNTPEENVRAVATSLGKEVTDVSVLVMDRDRHKELISRLRKLGCRLTLISDGDIMGALRTALTTSHVDLMLGIGAAPEGVIAAAGLKNLGGFFQGRLKFKGEELLERAKGDPSYMERARAAQKEFLNRAKEMGIKDPNKKLEMDDLVKGESVFVATAVTDGDIGHGVTFKDGCFLTNTMVIYDGTLEIIQGRRDIDEST